MSSWDILIRYRQAFLDGLLVTLQLASLSWVTGLCVGPLLGSAAHRWPYTVGVVLRFVAFGLSGIPFLVLLYWAHFPLQELLGVVIPPFRTAAFLLGVMNTIAVAEVWRGALSDLPSEYVAAARVCGLTTMQTLRYVQLPLVARQALPMLLALQVFVLQMTLFASLISVEEIFRVAQRINASIHKPIEIYSTLAMFFLVICAPVYWLAGWLRKRFLRDLSER